MSVVEPMEAEVEDNKRKRRNSESPKIAKQKPKFLRTLTSSDEENDNNKTKDNNSDDNDNDNDEVSGSSKTRKQYMKKSDGDKAKKYNKKGKEAEQEKEGDTQQWTEVGKRIKRQRQKPYTELGSNIEMIKDVEEAFQYIKKWVRRESEKKRLRKEAVNDIEQIIELALSDVLQVGGNLRKMEARTEGAKTFIEEARAAVRKEFLEIKRELKRGTLMPGPASGQGEKGIGQGQGGIGQGGSYASVVRRGEEIKVRPRNKLVAIYPKEIKGTEKDASQEVQKIIREEVKPKKGKRTTSRRPSSALRSGSTAWRRRPGPRLQLPRPHTRTA